MTSNITAGHGTWATATLGSFASNQVVGRGSTGNSRQVPRRRKETCQDSCAASDDSLLKKPYADLSGQTLLGHILALHPEYHLTIPALVEAILGRDSPDFGYGTELERAIRDYAIEGILWIKKGELWPTRLAFEAMGWTDGH